MKTNPHEPTNPTTGYVSIPKQTHLSANDCPDGIAKTLEQVVQIPVEYLGLTKREYFAAMAMRGIIAHGKSPAADSKEHSITEESVKFADALIKELNKDQ